MTALRTHAPAGTSIVVVADGPSDEQAAALEAETDAATDVEIVWTSERLGHAAATNIGIRRAAGRVVVLMDASVEPTGDVVTPLVRALDDPTVAVAGGWGITSTDLRTFDDAPAGDVDAIEGYLLAFRRADAATRGPLDERFRFYRNLDIWWSLVLRDEGRGRPASAGGTARRPPGGPPRASRLDEPARTTSATRQSKRNFYRIIDRFGSRRDLLVSAASTTT